MFIHDQLNAPAITFLLVNHHGALLSPEQTAEVVRTHSVGHSNATCYKQTIGPAVLFSLKLMCSMIFFETLYCSRMSCKHIVHSDQIHSDSLPAVPPCSSALFHPCCRWSYRGSQWVRPGPQESHRYFALLFITVSKLQHEVAMK